MRPTIEKCIEELKKPKPRKDYVIGLLEAVLDAQISIPMKMTSAPADNITTTQPVMPDVVYNGPKKVIIPPGVAELMNPPPELRMS